MRIAVVGGGIFGATAAYKLAEAGHTVTLFEKESDILQAASGINQFRLHRGYHYPRSSETVVSCLRAEQSFRATYAPAVIDDALHYYGIAAEGSLVSAEQFLEFCRMHGLEYTEEHPEMIRRESVELVVRVPEACFDPVVLRELCLERLQKHGVQLRLGVEATAAQLESYDKVVIATYASINGLLPDGVGRQYQFEVCEKPVVRLPGSLRSASIVIMDGPFMCMDRYGRTDMALLGNVVHAIHHTNTGRVAEIPEAIKPLINHGIIASPPVTNFAAFVASAAPFIPAIVEAEHVGSLFTVRTVLPHLDATDARPTTVESFDERTIVIFSGKIGNCVDAANQVVRLIA
jgi:FAD dependent oxidoreductase